MAWLGRLALYALIVGTVLFALGCEIHAATGAIGWLSGPWLAACEVINGPPPENPLEMRIVPQTWALPFYGAVRAATFSIGEISPKTIGLAFLASMLLAPLSLVFVNWSKTPARAWLSLLAAAIAFVALGWTGAQAPTSATLIVAQASLAIYLFTLSVAFPLLARWKERSPAAASD